ncbi:MAG: hypothetical protein Q9157_003102 [Trypethelium eluteriae]
MPGNAPGTGNSPSPEPAPNPPLPSPAPMPTPTVQPSPVRPPWPVNPPTPASPSSFPNPSTPVGPQSAQHSGASGSSGTDSFASKGSSPSDSDSDSGSNSGDPSSEGRGPSDPGSSNSGSPKQDSSRPESDNGAGSGAQESPGMGSQGSVPESNEASGLRNGDDSRPGTGSPGSNGGSNDDQLGGLQGIASAISGAAAQRISQPQGTVAPTQLSPGLGPGLGSESGIGSWPLDSLDLGHIVGAKNSETDSGMSLMSLSPVSGSAIKYSPLYAGTKSIAADDSESGSIGPAVYLPVGDGSTISAFIGPSGAIVLPDSETVTPGYAKTFDGISISIPIDTSGVPAGVVIVGNGLGASTLPITDSVATLFAPQSINIGGKMMPISYAPYGAGIVLPGGKTISVGEPTTINGVSIYLPSGEGYMLEGSSTIPLTAPAAEQSITIGSKIISISYAPHGQGIILSDGHTLYPGQETIISGSTLSLEPGETAVIINGKTVTLRPSAFTTGVGNYVASGIGLGSTSTDTVSYITSDATPASTIQASGSGPESVVRRKRSLWVLIVTVVISLLN